MMEKSNIDPYTGSDQIQLEILGNFLKEARLQKNTTQEAIAEAAGMHRSTIVRMEKGDGGTLLSFIQVLRVLDKLTMLQPFEVKPQVSPMQLAKLALQKRKRAGKPGSKPVIQPKSDW